MRHTDPQAANTELMHEMNFRLSLLRLMTSPHQAYATAHPAGTSEGRELEQLTVLIPAGIR
jgi:hypothetical protein